ncbi:peptidase S8 [Picosynechococcus sp. PCC 11901]|uniref:S8 family serine peptidase n=1 Tax=Picosynechococcus sp. PCC 11901 TaxID=2579791 RepID=UPI0010FC1456|nr:S8 family serine peptidase [Picosynechococcus sp. PCC 11901]QCS48839.1 peptidase S8 [Picosynechococcus sp. PCC 11901]
MARPGGTPQQQGLILQRGHTELLLHQLEDRLLVAFRSSDVDLLDIVPGLMYRPLPSGQPDILFEEILVPPEDFTTSLRAARQHPDILFAYPVYQLADSAEGFVYLTQQITLQFAPEVSPAAQKAIGDRHHLKKIRPLLGADQTFIYELTAQTDCDPLRLTQILQQDPAIALAEPNVLLPLAVRQMSLATNPQSRHWYLDAIQIPQAWQMTKGDRQTTIAVLAPDLDLENSAEPTAETSETPYGAIPEIRPTTWGNTIAQLVIDVAPECTLLLLQLPQHLDDALLEKVLDAAIAQGAAVILLAWQLATINGPLSLRQSLALHRAATQGNRGQGCLLITGAGDANRPLAGIIYERHWPNQLFQGPTAWLDGKGNHPAVVTVSGCTEANKKASHSNWGEAVSLCGPTNPGTPTLWLPEQGMVAVPPEISDDLGAEIDPVEALNQQGSTLEAAALVAGVTALVWSVNPKLTGWAVREILQTTAEKIVDLTGDRQLQLILGTYDAQGHSQWFGYGRVNALAAVVLAQGNQPD